MTTEFKIDNELERNLITRSVRTRIENTYDNAIHNLARQLEDLEKSKKYALEYFTKAALAMELENSSEASEEGERCARTLNSVVYELSKSNNSRLDLFAKAEIGVTALFNICPF